MELSCDNYVVSKSEYCSKADYALTLIKLEEKSIRSILSAVISAGTLLRNELPPL